MATIDVELDAFSNREIVDYLIGEIRNQYVNEGSLVAIKKALKMYPIAPTEDLVNSLNRNNLADIRKLEFIAEIFDKYTVEQLEEKLC